MADYDMSANSSNIACVVYFGTHPIWLSFAAQPFFCYIAPTIRISRRIIINGKL